jgi:dihydrofolate reductase
MKAIIAINRLGYIGLGGKLPWHCPADLAHFKRLTIGKKLIVGRVTYESMPILKGREIIVVGRGYNTLETALRLEPDFVIGGKVLFETLLPLCDELHISYIDNDTVGDVKAPDFSEFRGRIFTYNF